MTIDIAKFLRVVTEAEAERGPIKFFGLFNRENSPNGWDVVVSARWLDPAQLNGMRYLSQKLSASLSRKEMEAISRFVPIETRDEGGVLPVEVPSGHVAILANFEFGDDLIRKAIVIRSRKGKRSRSSSYEMESIGSTIAITPSEKFLVAV